MMLAFATFVGLGGDDIPKPCFPSFIGLVLSTVGLDIISGQPRLVFFEISGFFHGINFLVLAIGIYGIGEILWTIETSRGDIKLSEAKVSVEAHRDHVQESSKTPIGDHGHGVLSRLLRRHSARGWCNTGLADGLWGGKDHVKRPGELWQREHQPVSRHPRRPTTPPAPVPCCRC